MNTITLVNEQDEAAKRAEIQNRRDLIAWAQTARASAEAIIARLEREITELQAR